MKSDTFSLSVVIPVYNHGHLLTEAIESCLDQSRQADEIILIDDGSTDNTWEVIKGFASSHENISGYQNDKNEGIVHGLNRGTQLAKSEYILYRSADDISLPGFFETAMDMLEKHPYSDICLGEVIYFENDVHKGNKETLNLSSNYDYISPEELIKSWNQDAVIPGCACIVKKSAVTKAGGFYKELKWYTDWLTFMVVAFRGGICFCPKAFSGFRLSSESYGNLCLDKPEIQSEVYKNLIRVIKNDFPDLLPSFSSAGVLGVFGTSLIDSYFSCSDLWDMNALHLMQKPLIRWQSSVQQNKSEYFGIAQVIRENLKRNETFINQHLQNHTNPKVIVYGAGLHSIKLLSIWKEFCYPEITNIVTTMKTDLTTHVGIPVVSINDLPYKPDLILISSKSFEGAMSKICNDRFPKTPRVAFWAEDRSFLPMVC